MAFHWLAAFAVAALLPSVAQANQYGELIVTKNTTLSDHRFGNVVIAADDVTLDCNNYQVHVSSFSKTDCVPFSTSGTAYKCGIAAIGRKNVTIKNCSVVGTGFDFGVLLIGTEHAAVVNTSNTGAATGLFFEENSFLSGQNLKADTNSDASVTIAYDHYGVFNGISVGSTRSDGIRVYGAIGSSLFNSSVNDSARVGIAVRSSQDILIDHAEARRCSSWGFVASSLPTTIPRPNERISLLNGVFRENGGNGIAVDYTNNSYFARNSADSNAQTDAWQGDFTTGNEWNGNQFRTWGGTVPNAH